jgi:hypothetical protein
MTFKWRPTQFEILEHFPHFSLPNEIWYVFFSLALQRDPVEGFCVEPDESNFLQWKIWMEGPKGSP